MFFTPWSYQLYLLQLENYELRRFWRVLIKLGWWPEWKFQPRQKIVWTYKMKALFLLALILASVVFYLFEIKAVHYTWVWSVIIFVLIYFILVPFWISMATLLLEPFDMFIKQSLVQRAKIKLGSHKNLKIIGIAGSYGKTTAKEFIFAAVREQMRALKTPENINTPVGIARLILKTDLKSFDLFIVEMGEYKMGDVKGICELTKPDVAIVTGINEAHAERMGSIDNAKNAIFEVVKYAKEGAGIFVNYDDNNVFSVASKINAAMFYGAHESSYGFHVQENFLDPVSLQRKILIVDHDVKLYVNSNLIGEYIVGDVVMALSVVKYLGLDLNRAASALSKIEPIPHRLQTIRGSGDVLVIDDSYNGNPDGVKEAIKVLGSFNNKRRIFLTPGLVEMGENCAEIHRTIGKNLAEAANLVILIQNSVTPYIEDGLLSSGFTKDKIMWFNSAAEAHKSLGNILKPNDVILFQNDWTDNYF